MSWVRIDDNLTFHRKVVHAGNEAVGLWIRLLAWSSSHLTDGHIPGRIARLVAEKDEPIQALVESGLLHPDGGDGFRIHDYHDHNQKAEDVKAKRRADAERKAVGRKGQVRTESGRITSAIQSESERSPSGKVALSTGPDPTRPDPTYKIPPTPQAEEAGAGKISTSTTERAWNAAELGGLHGASSFEALADGLAKLALEPVAACKAFKRLEASWSKRGNITPTLMLKHIGTVERLLKGEVDLEPKTKPAEIERPKPPSVSEIRKRYE